MLLDMKEQMKNKKTQSDHDLEHVALDNENATHEQEALRQLNKQLKLKSLPSKTPQHLRSGKRAWIQRIS